ncbi:MAG: metal-dependent transcriptional regulator [Thermoproteota archaeon]
MSELSRKTVADRKRLAGADASSTAREDYVVTIYRLEEVFGYARTTHIARELGVRPATVTKIVSKLEEEGYVVWEKYRGARLTDAGRRLAEKIVRRHRIVERLLHDFVGLDLVDTHRYAHMMEHLPDEIVERVHERLGRPSTCPTGNPIPGESVPKEVANAVKLPSLQKGLCGRVVRVSMAVFDWGSELIRKGIVPGTRLCVKFSSPSHQVVEVNGGIELEIPAEQGQLVFVLPER